MAALYQARSQLDKAQPLFVESLAMRLRVHGDADSSDVARARHNLAGLHAAHGRLDEAEPLLHAGVAMFLRLCSLRHPTAHARLQQLRELQVAMRDPGRWKHPTAGAPLKARSMPVRLRVPPR